MSPLSSIAFTTGPEVRGLRGPVAPAGPGAISPAELEGLGATKTLQGPSQPFGTMLSQLVGDVATKQGAASEAVAGLLSGNHVALHQAMIAMEEASVSFQLMVEVRNKLMEAYQELMRMQV